MRRIKQQTMATVKKAAQRLGLILYGIAVRGQRRFVAWVVWVAALSSMLGRITGNLLVRRALFLTPQFTVLSRYGCIEGARALGEGDGHACASCGLGPESGMTQFHVFDDYTPASSVLESAHTPAVTNKAARTIDVPVDTLDRIFEPVAERLRGPVLLKLDVQGYEAHVLRGAPRVLRHVDACVLEVCNDPLYEGQATFSELHALAESAGLRFVGTSYQGVQPDGRVSYFDAVFRRRTV